MAKGYEWNVFRTDLDGEPFQGFFVDEDAANHFISKQTEGTYEASTERTHVRKARLEAEASA